MKNTHYRIGQSLPPRHWYQRRIGWFGKLMTGVMVLSFATAGATGYVMNRSAVKSFSAQTSNTEKLKKITAPLTSTTAENIIDIQFVLDKWAKENADQTWSVVAQSISGPTFEAHLNQDKQYESSTVQGLLLTLPLYSQVPKEHQKTIKSLIDGKQRSLESCLDVMVRLTNAECTQLIAKYIDFKKADESLKKVGLTKTSLNSYKSAKTTAADTARFLRLVQADFVNQNAQETVQRLLREQTARTGIPAGCPGCVTVNKSSTQDKVVYDAAIVQYNGGIYVLSIYSQDGKYQQIAELAGKIQQKILDTTTK